MRFIHTADIHYGMKPDSNKPWCRERSEAVKGSLEKIVSACKEYNVDCLFISGDLFHRQPLIKELKEVNYLFSTIKNVKVVIIAGNHDYIRKNSPILKFEWSDNVSYLTDGTICGVYFRELNTKVYGFSYTGNELKENALKGLKISDTSHINVLMAHGGDAKHLPFDKNELIKGGFSYYALGHIHKKEVLFDKRMVFPGSPEPLDMTETGKHGFFLGDINPVTKQVSSLEFIACADISYISFVINISPSSTNTELLMSITEEINKRGTNNIYRLTIKGFRDPDITFDTEVLQKRFKIAEIIDESEPDYDFSKLFREHSSDMIGFYIREFDNENLSEVSKKALYYGVDALLRTVDERR